MEDEQIQPVPEEEKEVYTPRPVWQVWTARIALVLFLAIIAAYYINIARGGL